MTSYSPRSATSIKILELFDAGYTIPEIVLELRVMPSRVKDCLRYYKRDYDQAACEYSLENCVPDSLPVMVKNGAEHKFEPKPVTEPTRALAGTTEKVSVLMRRVELGEELWHPGDNVPKITRSDRTLRGDGIREVSIALNGR